MNTNLYICSRKRKETAMKNSPHTPKDMFFEPMDHHIPRQTIHGAFENVRLSGRNVGASMIAGNEAPGSCSINIYINNDVQGVNNSLLLGSEVRMGDPGVRLSLEGLKLDRGFRLVSRNEGTYSNRLILLLALVTLILSIFAYLLL